MNLDIELREKTQAGWWEVVEASFDEFLIDHASCERKASATGIQFVVKYPERTFLIDPMIRFAREELHHFHQVSKLLNARGLQQKGDEKNLYVNDLLAAMRPKPVDRFLDRLLIFGIVEKRGTERFGIVGQNVKDPELKDFYQKLAEAEARHHELFIKVAYHYFPETIVNQRLSEYLEIEGNIFKKLPYRPSVH